MVIRRQLWGAIALALAGFSTPAFAQSSIVSTSTLSGATAFSDAKINNQGAVLYTATIASQDTVYTNTSGTNTLVVKQGDASPISGASYSSLDLLDYNLDDSGRVTFRSTLTPTASGPAIFRTSSAATTVIAQKGVTNVATAPGNTTLNTFGNYDANNNGLTVFSGRELTASNTAGNWGIWSMSASGVANQLVAQGAPAPGLSASARFNTFAFPSVDNGGNVSFFATITNDLNAGNGLFTKYADGTLSKIAAGGDVAAGVNNGFFSFFSRVTRNDANTTAFFGGATVGASELRGIWTGGSSLSLVAINGQTVTTSLGTATFGNTYSLGNLNAGGTGVFRASLTGAFSQAIFSFTGAELTTLLARGDTLFGSTVSALGIPSINDAGTVAVSYTLANGSAGILTLPRNAAVVPEGSTLALLGIGISALGMILQRKKRS